ncbi:MAG: 6-phosphofructokinase [Acidobacteria bacterium]|nr:6-phosphofructokinase [Acidobacteriota bacterium]
MHIGVLTGSGDCPGLNVVIRVIVVEAIKHNGWRVTGILEGWRGLWPEGRVRSLEPHEEEAVFSG